MNEQLRARIKTVCDGLYYISETDAPIDVINELDDLPSDGARGEITFEQFFAALIAVHEGYRELQITRAKKFLELKRLLEESLTDLKVYKTGSVRKTIYIVGRDEDGVLCGITTESVET